MQRNIVLFLISSFLLIGALPAMANDDPPDEIGGFKLGTSIDDYDFITYRNFLKEVIITDIEGFRKGAIYYGVCDRPGEVIRIKLKYDDPSLKFHKELLKRYKKKLGKPDEYVGDSFGIVKAWKWQFIDKEKRRISLTLQYNSKDTDESIGSTIKLSLPDSIAAERDCFNKMCAMNRPAQDANKPAKTSIDWDQLLPR